MICCDRHRPILLPLR